MVPWSNTSPLHLELGCGGKKRNPSAIGIDVRDLPGVDVVGDVLDTMREIPTGRVDSISSEHFLEHVENFEEILVEAARVLRTGGEFVATVPHFSNAYFYSDPTHRSTFGLYTFGYFVADSPLRRKVPQYTDPLPFELFRPVLGFKSPPPFYGRHAARVALGAVINRSRWLVEFWEENLSRLLPCYEITFRLRRT